MEGPCSAPSSPPDTPVPMYSSPLDSTSRVRRSVSVYRLLPPSIRMSPGCSSGTSWLDELIDRAAGLHQQDDLAWTARVATSSSSVCAPTKRLPLARPCRNSVTLAGVRLWTPTVYPGSRYSARGSRPSRRVRSDRYRQLAYSWKPVLRVVEREFVCCCKHGLGELLAIFECGHQGARAHGPDPRKLETCVDLVDD